MAMLSRFQSIRSIVTSIIIILGLLSLAATLATGRVYHRLTLQSQQENIERQLAQELGNTLQRLRQFSIQFGTLIINNEGFIGQAGSHVTEKYLRDLQQAPFLQNGVLNVRAILVYDNKGKRLHGLEYDGKGGRVSQEPVCGEGMVGIESSVYSPGQEVEYDICSTAGVPYLVARVPYDYKGMAGYLLLISDISSSLAQLDRVVTFPLRITLADGTHIYSAPNWPAGVQSHLVASHAAKDKNGAIVLFVEAVHQDRNLDDALSLAQLVVISGVAVMILLSVLLSLYILRQTVINPVKDVVSSLRMVQVGKHNLGAQVKSRGADEIIQLMDDFNAMSKTLQQLYSALEKMTYTDPLTRLGNRKLFHEKLLQMLEHVKQTQGKFVILMIDLNKFKQVNDSYGHQTGDTLLAEISNRYSVVIRDYLPEQTSADSSIATPIQDHLARLGGDEFAVILPDINTEADAIELAEQLLGTLDKPIIIDGHTIDIGMSIGIALYPQHGHEHEPLIHCADEAMYQAKQAGLGYKVWSND